MTEKQGGSDLRETQTTAVYSHSAEYHGAVAHWYELTGHKWFCSVPQSDGFFTLAKVNGGVTCFFFRGPCLTAASTGSSFNASRTRLVTAPMPAAKWEYSGTMAIRVGEEGRGLREILSHSHLTRLDFAVGSAGLMRQVLTLALNHTTTRNAFGSSLAKRPMMANVLADMAVEVEAATLMALRVARATDHIDTNPQEKALARVATPAAKYFNCSRVASDGQRGAAVPWWQRFRGGPPDGKRLYREAPLNSVWEGAANMMCMDVRRAMQQEANSRDALFAETWPTCADRIRDSMPTSRRWAHCLTRCSMKNSFARPATEGLPVRCKVQNF